LFDKSPSVVLEDLEPRVFFETEMTPGQFDHPDYAAALDRVVKAANENGKSLGRVVDTAEEGVDFYANGYDFIAIGTDTQVYTTALRSALERLRAGCE